MAKSKVKPERDVEKDYSAKQMVAKIRRLADCIEHEREGTEEEIEFQIKWSNHR